MTNLFQYEESLPKLPVPSLTSTISKLLIALKPLVSNDEYSQLINESTEFLNDPNVKLIQSHLKAISENPQQPCYLNSINDETSPGIYGELRGDILPRNPYLILQEDPYSKFMNPPNQQQRAASLINSSLKFIISLRNQTLVPDLTPKHGTPLTMRCYGNLFGATRTPDLTEKGNSHHIKIKKAQNPNNIVIISNNQFYNLEVLNDQNEIYFNDYDLSLILQSILETSKQFDRFESINNAIGSLTTQNYSYWKLARIELLKSNHSALSVIDDALFVVVLDPNSPTSDQEKTQCISHGSSELLDNVQIGSCTSRWYDKLQLIVTANSVAGIVWESTSMDSTAILRFISDIYTDSILKLAKNINAMEYSLFGDIRFVSNKLNIKKPSYERLIINKTPELLNLIHLSETRLADLINQHLYTCLKLKFNTELLRRFKLSIDSVLQICFQITNYTLYGKMVNTLEPITTRKFRDARTELIAVQNDDVFNLVKLYLTNSSRGEKWASFEKCCRNHTSQYLDAMKGEGFERHLTSLLHITQHPKASKFLNSINKELAPIDFADISSDYIPILSNPILHKILTPELLISNCGNPALYLFGIPPATDQGFGIGYIVHNDKVLLTLSSKFRQNERFLNTFVQIVNEIKLMLVSENDDFLYNLNKENSYRNIELQKLRIENELKNINIDSPSTKNPIELTIDQFTIPLEETNRHPKVQSDPPIINPPSLVATPLMSSPTTSSGSNDFDYLGGYGYFDFGELDLRNTDLNNSQSYFNSPSNYASKNHSSANLPAVQSPGSDVKTKIDLSEKIRDQLSSWDN